MAPEIEFFATCPRGVEALLAGELSTLGAVRVEERRAGVAFSGGLEAGYRACLWSRVASRVLMPLGRFEAPDEAALYDGVRAIDWREHLARGRTVAVDFTQIRSAITHTHFGALRTKDAICDRLRDDTGERPNVDLERPDVRIHVHVEESRAELSVDLSGESLHRRGRTSPGEAPLKENLAAAVLLLLEWPSIARAGGPLVDPMCGSGTLLLEAARIAADEAPGLGRTRFGFHGWRGHHDGVWQKVLEEARARRDVSKVPPLFGSDEDPHALAAAERNLQGWRVTLARRALGELEAPPTTGLVVTNPPYGERLGDDAALALLYRLLGDVLRRRFPGWRAGVLTGNLQLGKQIGLRPAKRHVLWNGAIECRLLDIPISTEAPKAEPVWRKPKPLSAGAEMFRNRLTKNWKHLGKWAKREEVSCLRLYDADLPEYAVAVDLYGDAAHVQEYAPPKTIDPKKAAERLDEAVRVVPEVLGLSPASVFLKVRRRQRPETQYSRVSDAGARREVEENGHRFIVNLSDYLDTGLYLDHRRLREMVGELAKDRRFLNLFCYTGTATVYAAKGGARESVSVDLSATYLEWAHENFALNRLDERKHRLLREDVLAWLPRERSRYGLILLTPPTFSNSKRMESPLDAQRDHAALIKAAADRLEPDGVILFSVHSQRFKLDDLPGLRAEEITHKTVPADFARSPRIHRAWRITR